MGTPGDKSKLDKVVIEEPPSPDIKIEEEPNILTLINPGDLSLPSQEQQQRDSSTMTVLSRLPEFPLLHQYSLELDPVGLEQAHIEDYYSQTKFYDTETKGETSKTFPRFDEPGPSGLQTPKSRPVPTENNPKISLKRSKKAQALTSTPPTAKKLHSCQYCQRTFQNSANLAKHLQIHGGTSPFKCDHCKKSFTSRFKLVRHVLIHSDRKQFSCTVCERTFHRKDHLKNHIKVHSPSKKVYVCTTGDCKKEYTSSLSFKKHSALHSAEEGNLECLICSQKFETKDDILYHLKIHAGSRTVKSPNEKKFTCEHCERRFFTRKDVRRHLVVHTGMRDFLCQFCPQRFGRKDHLVRHIKKSHSKNYPPESLDEQTLVKLEETAVKFEDAEVIPEPTSPEDEILHTLLKADPDPVSFLPQQSVEEVLGDLNVGPQSAEEAVTSPFLVEQDTSIIPDVINIGEEPRENLRLPAFSKTFQSPPQP